MIKHNALFFVGLFLFVVSGVWFLHEKSFEPLLAFAGSISSIFFDYVLKTQTVRKQSSQTSQLTIKRRRKGTSRSTYYQFRHFVKNYITFSKLLWFIFALYLIYIINHFFPAKSKTLPNVEIALCEKNNGQLKLIPLNEYTVTEKFTENQLYMYFQLALKNNEIDPLKVVRIELSYPKGLDIQSSGNAKIDPDNQLIIYEHDLGTIEPSSYFTPMKSNDVLTIPFQYKFVEKCYVNENNVPECLVAILDEALSSGSKTLSFLFTIYIEDRKPLKGTISNVFKSKVQVFKDAGPKVLKISKIFESLKNEFKYENGEIMDSWVTFSNKFNVKVEYKKVRYKDKVKQYLYVNDVLRKVLIGQDNWIGEQIINSDDDLEPDEAKAFGRFFMLEWKKKDFE